jgi:CRISPR-associated endoribonuclease Cas6
MTPDLYALIVRLVAKGGGSLRTTQGRLAHAAFLDLLRQADPPLSAALHDSRGRKPFTLSPLLGLGYGQDGRLLVRPGDTPWLRITLLDPALFRSFIRYFLQPGRQPRLRLGSVDFQVAELISTPGTHPLAGFASLSELFDRWESAELTEDLRRVVLQFRSPTVFSLLDNAPSRPKGSRRMHVLPEPSLVFGELAGAWDRLTGGETRAAVRDYAADCVVVARHDIETHMYDFGGGHKQVGFTGQVAFQLMGQADEPLVRHLNRLADLAFFTGVGSKTTMGMGQVNRPV